MKKKNCKPLDDSDDGASKFRDGIMWEKHIDD